MFLYNLTLQAPNAINQAILGNFSGTRQQELIVSHVSRIELLRPDTTTGKVHSILSHDVFGVVRSLASFRLTGASKDYIVIGSDSGRIVILEYNPAKNVFEKVHQETFGKSGCRRIVPGQYLATDPKGRAVMIGSMEKQKLVYILNRDIAARLTIGSPLEAHKSHTIVHYCTGVDVGFENPIFACLEVDYSEADQDPKGEALRETEKMLTYYELDLGLNHVVRKWSEAVDRKANMLVAVPGGTDGPSGVLVCSENYITYKHIASATLSVPIPRRESPLENKDRGLLIVSGVVHKMKNSFFLLLQSEEGDLYKVTIDYTGDTVNEIKIKYFDTVSVASGLCILKSGFLFVASEFGNHHFYQFEKLGDDDDTPEYSSNDFMGADGEHLNIRVYFKPRPLENLLLVDELASMAPLTDAKVLNLTDEDTPQIYALCGRGARSTMRILRHGLEVTEMAVSPLPANPTAVWTTRLTADDLYDQYIVVSFSNATLVLSIGETVEEVTDTGFLATTPTITVQQLGQDALLQVYPQGIRHIRANKQVTEWRAPGGRQIVRAATNRQQVVIALTGGELVYFEVDDVGNLSESHVRREMSGNVTCLSIQPLPKGRRRVRFLAVGCDDNTVRILSLDASSCLEPLSLQALSAIPESLVMIDMPDQISEGSLTTLYLNIGLQNGVLLRTVLDQTTGQLSDTRTRFLGARAVRLFELNMAGNPSVLALSSRPWLSYQLQSRIHLNPLSYEALEYAASFTSKQCLEGVVAIAGKELKIFTIEKFGQVFNETAIQLTYTPRRFVVNPVHKTIAVIETDHQTYSTLEKKKRLEELGFAMREEEELDPVVFGHARSLPGKWASLIRILNPATGETTFTLELEQNEAALSVAVLNFAVEANELFLAVGTAADLTLQPKSLSSGFIHIYKFVNEGKGLELVHKTPVEEVPQALLHFQGRLLAGVGKILRVYDLGKRKLLRKTENRMIPNAIVTLHNQGGRIIIGDVQESLHYASYIPADNKIVTFADDKSPRWVTCSAMIDYDTVAAGDKFGNFFVNRLPQKLSQEIDEDEAGSKSVGKGYLHGAAHKVDMLAHYHVGDILTSLAKTSFVAGGREMILYTSFLGGIGIFIPFQTKEDIDFFQTLEMHMRNEMPPLAGRDHLSYRGYHVPVKGTVDGDICEQYNLLSGDKKRMIAEELDRTPAEIQKKIEDMRIRAI
ncbi:CPSF A subunit region-domain-containing protein [Lobosporangium transversale]|uniref:CPSF A subunit region-domain-containing protein n=1 Tax=Lobosporangium transversale TaxID=64571 RepID=A0A1Y2GK81_9FUNG|nr:CPSF A subunit region-domain-containing protein [Lobosporangium transversale]ORZ13418.1 CPSF A subunit region-domain-containing protein [Lobosporangium transversale]|eukprot:XP_021880499.1 CPSF A subunit region-domain-containing protein [Lobosporangium transversale]